MEISKRRRKAVVKDYAILLCAEYFRDELDWGITKILPGKEGELLRDAFKQLRELCVEALGDISLKDANYIKRLYEVTKAK